MAVEPNAAKRHGSWRGYRVMAGAIAVAVSALLHLGILRGLPPVNFGRPLTLDELVSYPAINIQDVIRVRQESRIEEARRLRPEDPTQMAELFGEPAADSADALAELEAAAAPELPVPELIPAEPVTPDYGPVPGSWDARAEILQVERRLQDDAAAALPRKFGPAVTRSTATADIVLPVESAAMADFAAGAASTHEASPPTKIRPFVLADGGGGFSMAAGGRAAFDPAAVDPLAESPGAISALDPVEQYLRLAVRAFKPDDEPGTTYVEIRIHREGSEALPVLPKDVILMQDCSESMTPWKLAACKRGLRRWMDYLSPGDRLEVVGFADQPRGCFGGWVDFSSAARAVALKFIDDMRATGNTDVYASLAGALGMPRSPGRPVLVLLVTDGRPTTGVTASTDIIERFTGENNDRLSVFTMGGGEKVNRFLLDLLSYRNRGDTRLVTEVESLPSSIEDWARELARPVLTDLSYRFAGVSDDEVYPRTITHLFLDRPLVILGRFSGPTDRAAFQVVGQSGAEQRDMVFNLDLTQAEPGAGDIRRRWAWQKIYHLIGNAIQLRDPAVLEGIQSHADRYGLVVPYGYGRGAPRD